MLNRRVVCLTLLMVATLAVISGCSAAANAASSASPPNRTITVVGAGKAFGSPDVARVTVGIETRDAAVQVAADENSARMTELLSALKGLGIADKDIQTSNYSVFMDRKPVPVRVSEADLVEEPSEFVVTNQVMVTVRDLNKLGSVLEEAVASGANSIYGIHFTVDDPSEMEAEARADAVSDAADRADSLAELSGVEVGEVIQISEVIGSTGPVPKMESAGGGMGLASVPVEAGELQIGMSVQVTYAIK